MNRDKVLTIGIDVRDLKVAKTGQKTVTEELCRQFRTYEDDSVRFIFFDTRFPAYTGRKKMIILLEHIRYQAWKQIILPIKAWYHDCDIVFCGDYFVPYIHLGFKTVEIFYDAFFFEYPEHYNRPWRMLFHGLAIPAAKRCSYIMTITDYAKKKIHSYTGIPENKLVTIYPGPKTLPDTGNDTPVPPHLEALTRHRYILHVGVMEKRKNLPALIRAFSRLKEVYHQPIKLVLVGQGNGKVFSDDSEQVKAAIRDCRLEKEVILLGYLPDEEVAIAYKHAFMYVFPSFNEGFGIPVMEAFKFGLPVLVANNSCLPEVGGDAVVTFDPFDKEDMVAKMKQVLEDEALRKGLVEKGYKRLRYFSWKKAADQLVAVFKRAHEGV